MLELLDVSMAQTSDQQQFPGVDVENFDMPEKPNYRDESAAALDDAMLEAQQAADAADNEFLARLLWFELGSLRYEELRYDDE